MALRTTTAAYSPKQMEQTCAVLKIQVLWDITQCRLVNVTNVSEQLCYLTVKDAVHITTTALHRVNIMKTLNNNQVCYRSEKNLKLDAVDKWTEPIYPTVHTCDCYDVGSSCFCLILGPPLPVPVTLP